MLYLEAVEPHTFSVLNQLMKMPALQDFSLVGGTALSLLYGHRISADLDLFSNKPFENSEIINGLRNEFKDKFIMEDKPVRFGIFCFVDEVKVDFVRHPHPLVGPEQNRDGVRMFSAEDIIAMKVQAILGRGRKKDYSHSMLACSLGMAGQIHESLEKAKRGVEIEPNALFAHFFLGSIYHWANKFEEAEKTFQIALAMSNRHSWALTSLGILYVDWDQKEKVLEIYHELKSTSNNKYIQPSMIALLSAALGYNDEALRFAHQACDERDPFIIFTAKCWPSGKALRAVPGFNEVLKRIKLT